MIRLILALVVGVSFSPAQAALVHYQSDMQMVPANFYPYLTSHDHYSASVDAVWDTETNTFPTFSISVIGYPVGASIDPSDTVVYLGQPWTGTGDDSDGIVHALPNNMTQDVNGDITFRWDGYDPVAHGMAGWLADTYLDIGSARFTIYGNIQVVGGVIVDVDSRHWGEPAFTASFDPTSTGVSSDQVPSVSTLLGAYPNPFNPSTTIAFELPGETRASLRVFDVTGRSVRTLLDDALMQGGRNEVIWNGRDASGRIVSSGVYFCRFDAGEFSETKRMVLMK